jgi:hypothetical protein
MREVKTISAVILVAMVAMVAVSCHPGKHIAREKSRIDSLYKSWHDSAAKATEEREAINTRAIQEARKGSIEFRQLPCPECPTVDVSACKDDSLKKLINQLQAANGVLTRISQEAKNKLVFFENGQLKSAEGSIKSITYDLETAKQEAEFEREKKELAVKKADSLQVELNKRTTSRNVERSGMPWYFILGFGIIIGMVATIVFYERRGKLLFR